VPLASNNIGKGEMISRKYITVLAIAAGGILVAGVLLKPEKRAPEPPSPSETARLQRLLRAEEMRRSAGYLAERARAASRSVVWAPGQEASGVAWSSGQVVTAAKRSRSGVPLAAVAGDNSASPATVAGPPEQKNWTLIVARNEGADPLWTAALYGGERPATCGRATYRELAIGSPLSESFAGAGIFDLEGNLVGIVGRCKDRRVAITARDVPALLEAAAAIENRIPDTLGFSAGALSIGERSYFRAESGLLVRTVWLDSRAWRSGLRPGDVIVSIAGQRVEKLNDLRPLLEAPAPLPLTVIRNGRQETVTAGAADDAAAGAADLGLELEARTFPRATVAVSPGSAAYRAGLRTGDAIVQIGRRTNPSVLEARRALSGPGEAVYLVYERDSQRTGVLLTK
jgi:hypothetical protein